MERTEFSWSHAATLEIRLEFYCNTGNWIGILLQHWIATLTVERMGGEGIGTAEQLEHI